MATGRLAYLFEVVSSMKYRNAPKNKLDYLQGCCSANKDGCYWLGSRDGGIKKQILVLNELIV